MPISLKIAVVEDHDDLRELLVDLLRGLGHEATGLICADDLDEFLVGNNIDLLILDLNLPGEDGYSLARRLRAASPELHIVMLTARTSTADRIMGYACGADIYLSKPVSQEELGAIVASIANRVGNVRQQQSALVLDMQRLTVHGCRDEICVSRSEAVLLRSLAAAPQGGLPYWRMLELLELEVNDKNKAVLEVRISRLKRKLHDAGAAEPAIKAQRKEGYQLCVPLHL